GISTSSRIRPVASTRTTKSFGFFAPARMSRQCSRKRSPFPATSTSETCSAGAPMRIFEIGHSSIATADEQQTNVARTTRALDRNMAGVVYSSLPQWLHRHRWEWLFAQGHLRRNFAPMKDEAIRLKTGLADML